MEEELAFQSGRQKRQKEIAFVHEIGHVHGNVNTNINVNTTRISALELEKAAAEQLHDLLDGVNWLHDWKVEQAKSGPDKGVDLMVTLPLPDGGKALLLVKCKRELRPSQFRQLAETFPPAAADAHAKVTVPLLALPSMTPRVAELCEERGWSWLDLAGNHHLDIPGLLRLRDTGKEPVYKRPKPRANLGTPVAGRVIRALLAPEHAGWGWTQRYLEVHFGTLNPAIPEPSLGLINKVVRHLIEEAFIMETAEGKYRVSEPLRLLSAWRDAYRFGRHQRRRYFTLLQGKRLHDSLALLGSRTGNHAVYASFSAAEIQWPHVRQPKTWLFIREEDIPLLENHAEAKPVDSGENMVVLIPDDEGVFYEGDGGSTGVNRMACTNPVQTYVDVWHSGGRGQEAAEALLEHRIKPAWKLKGLNL